MAVSNPAMTIMRFVMGGCGGCLCQRMCEPCRTGDGCTPTLATVERTLPDRVVMTDGRVFPRPGAGAPRAGDQVLIDCSQQVVHRSPPSRPTASPLRPFLWIPSDPLTYSVSAPLPERWPGAGHTYGGPGTLTRHNGWAAQEVVMEGRGTNEFAAAIRTDGTLHAITVADRGAAAPGPEGDEGWAVLHEISPTGAYTYRVIDGEVAAAGAVDMFALGTGACVSLPGGGLMTMGFSFTYTPSETEGVDLYDELRVHTYTISESGETSAWTSAPMGYLAGETVTSKEAGRSNPAPELGAIFWTLLDGTILKVTPGAAISVTELPDQALRIAEPGTFFPPVDQSEVEVPIPEVASTLPNLHVFRRINPTLRSFQVATQTLSAAVTGTEDLGGGWTLLRLDHVPAGVVAQWPSEPPGALLPHLPALMVLDLAPEDVPAVVTWDPDYAPTLTTGGSTAVWRDVTDDGVLFDPGSVPHVIQPEPLTGIELFPTSITGIADLVDLPQVPALSGRPTPELLWEVPEGGGQFSITFPPAPQHARGAVISLAIRTDWQALSDDGGDLWIGDGSATRYLSHQERGWFIVTRPVTGTENFTLNLSASIPLTVEIGQLSLIHTIQEGI